MYKYLTYVVIGIGKYLPACLLASNLVKLRQDGTSTSSCHTVLVLLHDVGWWLHLVWAPHNNIELFDEQEYKCHGYVVSLLHLHYFYRLGEGLTLVKELRHLHLNECDLNALPETFGRWISHSLFICDTLLLPLSLLEEESHVSSLWLCAVNK